MPSSQRRRGRVSRVPCFISERVGAKMIEFGAAARTKINAAQSNTAGRTGRPNKGAAMGLRRSAGVNK